MYLLQLIFLFILPQQKDLKPLEGFNLYSVLNGVEGKKKEVLGFVKQPTKNVGLKIEILDKKKQSHFKTVYKEKFNFLINDTVIFFDWDLQNSWNQSTKKIGKLHIDIKNNKFSIENIVYLTNINNKENRSNRYFTITKWTETEFEITDNNYKEFGAIYRFRKMNYGANNNRRR